MIAEMEEWYLLDDGANPAADNMARDEFLLERAEKVGGAPVLRLYSFCPPAISIGFHQDPAAVLDLGSLRGSGIDLVRRITGGRALLHDGELTYAVAAPLGSGGFDGELGVTFLMISEALEAALRDIGVDARIVGSRRTGGDGEAGRRHVSARRPRHERISSAESGSDGEGQASPCLASISRYEIAVRGRKIAGSAQRRTRRAFLQHGSILLRPASGRIAEYVRGDWRFLEGRITSVAGERGGVVDEDEVRTALTGAFSRRFSVRWKTLSLSPEESREVERRARIKRDELTPFVHTEVGG